MERAARRHRHWHPRPGFEDEDMDYYDEIHRRRVGRDHHHPEEETKDRHSLAAANQDRDEEMKIDDGNPTYSAFKDQHAEKEAKDRNPTGAATRDRNEEMEIHGRDPTSVAGQDQHPEEEKTYQAPLQ